MKNNYEVKLSEIADIISGGTPSTESEEFWNGNIEWFTPSEIGKNKYIQNSKRKISEIGLQKSSAKLIPSKSILMSTRATIGELAINNEQCTTNQGFQNLVPKNEIVDLEYLYYRMKTMKNKMVLLSSGSTFLELSATDVKNLKIFIHDYDKQIKYGNLLSQMDNLIELTSEQAKNIQKEKIYYLNKFFNTNTENYTNAKLGDIITLQNNRRKPITSANRNPGKYPYYGATGISDYVDSYIFMERRLLIGEDGAKWGKNEKTSFIAEGKYWVNNHAHVSYFNNVNMYYIKEQLNFLDLSIYVLGNAPAKLNMKSLLNIKIKLHSNEEQEKIGLLLSSMDELQELYSQYSDEVSNAKKYNLNEIFS